VIEANVVKIVRGQRMRSIHHAYPCSFISPSDTRIAPALAVFAEKIGRDAGHDLGIEFGVEAKQLGMGPDIGAVEIPKIAMSPTTRIACWAQ